MGKHEIGPDGVSYSLAKRMENDADKAEIDIAGKLIVMHRKCVRFFLHNGTHVGSLLGAHVVALFVLEHTPVHTIIVFLSH